MVPLVFVWKKKGILCGFYEKGSVFLGIILVKNGKEYLHFSLLSAILVYV